MFMLLLTGLGLVVPARRSFFRDEKDFSPCICGWVRARSPAGGFLDTTRCRCYHEP